MSLRGFVTDLLDRNDQLSDANQQLTWTVVWDVDDYEGPGWWLSKGGPNGGERVGCYSSQEDAVADARKRASSGDKLEVWDRGAYEPATKLIE